MVRAKEGATCREEASPATGAGAGEPATGSDGARATGRVAASKSHTNTSQPSPPEATTGTWRAKWNET